MPWYPDLFSAPVLERIRGHAADACALEYNTLRWGPTELPPPEAGLAVYVRGATGKLTSVRIYDDVDPPLGY